MKVRLLFTLSLAIILVSLGAPQVEAMRQEGLLSAIQSYSARDGARTEITADVTNAPAPIPVVSVTKPVDTNGGSVPVAGGATADGGAALNIPTGTFGDSNKLTLSISNAAPDVAPPSGTRLLKKTVEILLEKPTSLSKTVELDINVSATELAGRDANKLQGGVIMGDVVESRPTKVTKLANGGAILTITIDHFTKFTLFEALLPTPSLTGPDTGSTLASMGTTLNWTNPPGVTQYHLQVTPFNGDGPGVNVIGNATTSFFVPSPPEWYGMLPDTTYFWRVRTTTVTVFPIESQWGPWVTRLFRTPKVNVATLSLNTPAEGSTVDSLFPTLAWNNSNLQVFYYEMQLSKDSTFNDPPTGAAMIYAELRHGGVTSPPNSYTVPPGFPLEAGTTYYWRVRPRLQADSIPVPWPKSFTFTTPAAAGSTSPAPLMATTP